MAQPEATVSPDAVTRAMRLLDDPFVRELLDGVGVDAEPLHTAVRDASMVRTTAHVMTLSGVLSMTQHGLGIRHDATEEDADEAIHRAVLALVLDDAAALLELSPHPENEQQDPIQRDTARARSIGQ